MKKIISLAIIVVAMFSQVQAQKTEIYAPGGKAIRGYDPVAFFTDSKPVMGADSLSFSWKGATWQFANRQNLQRFKANPEKYAPQYGGYCAYGMSEGHKAPTDPNAWTIVNDKLYLNYSPKVKEMWIKNPSERIEMANKNWTTLKDKESKM